MECFRESSRNLIKRSAGKNLEKLNEVIRQNCALDCRALPRTCSVLDQLSMTIEEFYNVEDFVWNKERVDVLKRAGVDYVFELAYLTSYDLNNIPGKTYKDEDTIAFIFCDLRKYGFISHSSSRKGTLWLYS